MENKLLIPGAIVLAGAIVAGAVWYSRMPPSGKTLGVESPKTPSVEERRGKRRVA